MKKFFLFLLPSIILFIIVACERDNEISPIEKEVYSSSIVNDFFTIDEELYNQLLESKIFKQLSEDYCRMKWDIILRGQNDNQMIDSIVQHIYELGTEYSSKNILAYCLHYGNNSTILSRAHEWGMCFIYPFPDGACDFVKYWRDAWYKCELLERDASFEIGGDIFDLNGYRKLQRDFLSVSHPMIYPDGRPGNMQFIYGQLYKDLAITLDMHPIVGAYSYAKNLSPDAIVAEVRSNVQFDDYICPYIFSMESAFMDFYYSNVWIYCIISENTGGGTSNPDVNNPIPDDDKNDPYPIFAWEKTTYNHILNVVAKNVGFSETVRGELKLVSEWCDSFLKGSEFSSLAYLHAMNTDPTMSADDAKRKFEDHLSNCFTKYIEVVHLGKLGEALHGIIDSYSAKHIGFKYLNPLTTPEADIVKHLYWNSPDHIFYTELILTKIINILDGKDNVANNDQRSREERALDVWREAYSKIHQL